MAAELETCSKAGKGTLNGQEGSGGMPRVEAIALVGTWCGLNVEFLQSQPTLTIRKEVVCLFSWQNHSEGEGYSISPNSECVKALWVDYRPQPGAPGLLLAMQLM